MFEEGHSPCPKPQCWLVSAQSPLLLFHLRLMNKSTDIFPRATHTSLRELNNYTKLHSCVSYKSYLLLPNACDGPTLPQLLPHRALWIALKMYPFLTQPGSQSFCGLNISSDRRWIFAGSWLGWNLNCSVSGGIEFLEPRWYTLDLPEQSFIRVWT